MVLHVQALQLDLYRCESSYVGIFQEFNQTSFCSRATLEANLLCGAYLNALACQQLHLCLFTLILHPK